MTLTPRQQLAASVPGDEAKVSVLRAALLRLDECLASGRIDALTPDDVGLWLHDLGLGQLEPRVREAGVSGLILMHMTADDLEEALGSYALAARLLAHTYIARWKLAPLPHAPLPTTGMLSWGAAEVDQWLSANEYGMLAGRGWDGVCLTSLSVTRLRNVANLSLTQSARLLAATKVEKERHAVINGAPVWTLMWTARISIHMLPPARDLEGELARIHREMSNLERLRGTPPDEIVCPITRKPMEDPVTASDGCTYERAALERFLALGNRESPETGETLPSRTIGPPNTRVKRMVEAWKNGDRL